ncbi:MAG: diadenylate cyclase CdaA [Oscillospiraceae bacterium]|jgi:diadenylate cyclase|nr:diadenylate cyclase CdaA [Oscillospiraceae bacterium]
MIEVLQEVGQFFERVWAILLSFRFNDLLDILFVALIIYGLIRLLRDTRSVQLLKGLFWLLVAWGAVNMFRMNASRILMENLFNSFALLLLILFQPEIRSMFENVGRSNVSNFKFLSQRNRTALEQEEIASAIRQICEAFAAFCQSRTGALVVFEQDTMLGEIVKTGTALEAKVTKELVGTVFFPNAPLHDGAAVIRKGYLAAAGCILPLTQNPDLDSTLGTRHRAAIGMSEQCDALVAVVSEETGQISLARKGVLRRDLSVAELESALRQSLLQKESGGGFFPLRWLRKAARKEREE